MTTLNPSHFPWRARDDDPTTGGAVHTSVRAPFASTSRDHDAGNAAAIEKILDESSSDEEGDADEHEHGDHHLEWLKKRKATNKARRRQDREDARAQGRIPTIPVPDVRFEQSYLMSIQPFIHSQPVPQSPKEKSSVFAANPDLLDTPSKQRNNEKRRRVEESLALVEDPASRTGTALDDLLHASNDRRVSIEWGQIAYITIRDQVFSPLVQGALWAFGGIILSSVYSSWRATSPPASASKKSPSTFIISLRQYMSNLVGPALAGVSPSKK